MATTGLARVDVEAPAPRRRAGPVLAHGGRTLRDALGRMLPATAAILLLAGVWETASRLAGLDGLPSVGATLGALPELIEDPDTLFNIAASLRRMLTGFALALALALPLGLLMGRSRIAARLINPLMMAVYPVPKAALMPIIMLWLGVGDLSKTIVIVLGVSLPILYHSYQGARGVEEKMLWSAAAMGLSGPARLARIVLPAALPEILVGCRTGIVLALITMVTSEMIARQSGIGNVIFSALDLAQYETVYAAILLVAVLGIALDAAFERLRAWLVGWASPRPEIAVGSA